MLLNNKSYSCIWLLKLAIECLLCILKGIYILLFKFPLLEHRNILGSVDKKQGREEKSGSLTKWT